jgi:hypothetical protein
MRPAIHPTVTVVALCLKRLDVPALADVTHTAADVRKASERSVRVRCAEQGEPHQPGARARCYHVTVSVE